MLDRQGINIRPVSKRQRKIKQEFYNLLVYFLVLIFFLPVLWIITVSYTHLDVYKRQTLKRLLFVGMVLLLVLSTSTVFGFELGRFDGTTIKACFIGGGDYEKIYEKFIPEFEELTGAKVEIVYKGNGFDIDKKMKIDFAAGTVDYDVCWDHTLSLIHI